MKIVVPEAVSRKLEEKVFGFPFALCKGSCPELCGSAGPVPCSW